MSESLRTSRSLLEESAKVLKGETLIKEEVKEDIKEETKVEETKE